MNIEEWLAYFEVDDIEDVTFYKDLPCIEKTERTRKRKILYPLPLLEESAKRLPPCTITHLSYEIHDNGFEVLSLDLEFEHFSCFFNLVVNHTEDERLISFTDSVVSTMGYSKTSAYVTLLQTVYTLMKEFAENFSPSRLEMITATYDFRLPDGVKNE